MKIDELVMTHYYYEGTEPLKNIMLLDKDEAFRKAAELAAAHPNTTSFYRFADFVNYYPRRKAADEYVRRGFIARGGKPELAHPYSFVLFESDYMNGWFDKGGALKVDVSSVPEDNISFTFGDSCSTYAREGRVEVYTKAMLEAEIEKCGSIENFREAVQKRCAYIEVQVWCELK